LRYKEVTFEGREVLHGTLYGDSEVGVVLCPPHPLYGGNRNDTRLVRIAKELALHNISTLCIDYGSYGGGAKEVQDVLSALSHMEKKVRSLGLGGYSFGAVVASNAAAKTAKIRGFAAMSILKRVNGLEASLEFVRPKLFIHGRLDDIAPYPEFERLYSKVKGEKEKLILDTDHLYLENYPEAIDLASKRICKFFSKLLLE